MFRGYYDVSGTTSDTSVVTAAGIVATEEKWCAFDKGWRLVLDRFGVEYFHAREFNADQGPFRGWRGDNERHAAFSKALISELKLGMNKGFVVSAVVQEIESVNSQRRLYDKSLGVYGFCRASCIRSAHDWVKKKYSHEGIDHVVESGDPGEGALIEFLNKEKIRITPRPKKCNGEWLVPLQAADLIAWEYRRGHTDVFLKGRRGPKLRRSFFALVVTLPIVAYHFDRAKLARTCEEEPDLFPFRQESEQ